MLFILLFLFTGLTQVSTSSLDNHYVDQCVKEGFLFDAHSYLNKFRPRALIQGCVFDHLRKGRHVPEQLELHKKTEVDINKNTASPVVIIPIVYPQNFNRPNIRNSNNLYRAPHIIPVVLPNSSFDLYYGDPDVIGPFILTIPDIEAFLDLFNKNVLPPSPNFLFIPSVTSQRELVEQSAVGSAAVKISFPKIFLDRKLSVLSSVLKGCSTLYENILAIYLIHSQRTDFSVTIIFHETFVPEIRHLRFVLGSYLDMEAQFIDWNTTYL